MKKKTAVIIIALLCAGVLGLGAYAVWQDGELEDARRVGGIGGEQALRELTEALYATEQALRESAYATDPKLYSRLCMDAAAGSASALTALTALPCSTQELERTVQFVNGAGDYAASLARTASRGALPDQQARAGAAELADTVAALSERVTQIGVALSEGALVMDSYGECGDSDRTDTVGYELRAAESELPEYPELAYDGMYSRPAAEKGTVTQEEARRTAALFLALPEQRLEYEGEGAGALPCHYFTVTADGDDERQRIAVDMKSGAVAAWSSPRSGEGGDVTEEQAAGAAADYLAARGYESMTEASRSSADGACTVAFTAVDRGVPCLPDTVSVSVSLSDGEPCAFNAYGYLENHRDRGELAAAVSPAEAAETLPENLSVSASRLIITELHPGEELLCHELVCQGPQGETVTVYVNASSGAQEKITIAPGAEA